VSSSKRSAAGGKKIKANININPKIPQCGDVVKNKNLI
jgi:hypothetical protein